MTKFPKGFPIDPEYIAARRVLLDALSALQEHAGLALNVEDLKTARVFRALSIVCLDRLNGRS